MAKVFGAQSTTDEVLEGVDLTGKRFLVTGVSAGLGVETARVLTAHGAEVVGTARDLDKARRATDGIVSGTFEIVDLDLASLKSVRACADALNSAGRPFDVVIANAGVMACPQGKTKDGFELQFGTNHLGHFVFVNRIAPLIKQGGRVVCVSSLAHKFADVELDDPNFETTPYTEFGAYGPSKTANALFALEFDRRHNSRGVRAASVHPGAIPTELVRHMTPEMIEAQTKHIMEAQEKGDGSILASSYTLKTVPQGAATSVWAAVVADADVLAGRYCEDCHVADSSSNPAEQTGVMPHAQDGDRAKLLWALSEKLVGEAF